MMVFEFKIGGIDGIFCRANNNRMIGYSIMQTVEISSAEFGCMTIVKAILTYNW